MNDYKQLIAKLIEAANRNSNSLNTRDTCRKAIYAIEQLVKERNEWYEFSFMQAEQIGQMLGDLNKMRIERDIAINDLSVSGGYCVTCKHFSTETNSCNGENKCLTDENENWEWRKMENNVWHKKKN